MEGIKERWLKKELLGNKSVIYRALLKYGYQNFRLDILEYCEKSKCINRKQYYIDTLSSYYNICAKGGSSQGRLITDTTRLKLIKARMILLYKRSNNRLSLSEFIVEYLLMKVNKLELNFTKLQKELNSIKKSELKQLDFTRFKKLQASSIVEPVAVLDLN